jgi:hypothetical protein
VGLGMRSAGELVETAVQSRQRIRVNVAVVRRPAGLQLPGPSKRTDSSAAFISVTSPAKLKSPTVPVNEGEPPCQGMCTLALTG